LDDETGLITSIFWWLLAFALSMLMISVGAAWWYLAWLGILSSTQVWLALLVFGLGMTGALLSLVGVIRWLLHQAPE
jgi:uncharacterized membrane protein